MIIENKYTRKLVWGIGFAIFCAVLAAIYSVLCKKSNRVVIAFGNHRKEVISGADFITFFIMVFLAAIRLNVGSDYYNYYVVFNNVKRDLSFSKELLVPQSGYYLLSYIIKHFTENEYAIFGVIAVIIYGFLFHLMKDEVEDRPAAFTCYLFLGFFANSLNILRQCVAMMFVMYFYKMMRQKNIVRCISFALLAVLFHYSSIVIIMIISAMTILKIPPSKKLLLVSITVGIIMVFLLPQIISFIIRLVPSASGYATYINWRRNNQIRLVLAVVGSSLMYAYLLFIVLRNCESIKKVSEIRYLEISFLIIGLCINIASIRIWVVQRMALYFYQYIILIIPAMFQGMEPTKRKKVKMTMYISMFIFLVFLGIFMGENEYYSYNTIFSGDSPIYDADFNRIFN